MDVPRKPRSVLAKAAFFEQQSRVGDHRRVSAQEDLASFRHEFVPGCLAIQVRLEKAQHSPTVQAAKSVIRFVGLDRHRSEILEIVIDRSHLLELLAIREVVDVACAVHEHDAPEPVVNGTTLQHRTVRSDPGPRTDEYEFVAVRCRIERELSVHSRLDPKRVADFEVEETRSQGTARHESDQELTGVRIRRRCERVRVSYELTPVIREWQAESRELTGNERDESIGSHEKTREPRGEVSARDQNGVGFEDSRRRSTHAPLVG